MNPRQFLLLGGIALIFLAVLGFANVIGPTPEESLFGETWWFDNGENWTHLIFGIAALVSAYSLSNAMQKALTMALGVIGILIGLYSLFISQMFMGSNLENPADSLLHLALGAWGLAVSMDRKAKKPIATGI